MKILHFTLGTVSLDSSNGVNQIIHGLAKYGNRENNVYIEVISFKKNLLTKYKVYQRDGFKVTAYNNFFKILEYIYRKKNEIDIIHLHNAWSFKNLLIFYFSKILNISTVLSIHGSLSKDRILNNKFYLKKIFHLFFQRTYFNNVDVVHCNTKTEKLQFRYHSKNKSICILTNGVDVESLNEEIKKLKIKKVNKKIIIGSIGRLSKEKNFESLIHAIDLLDENLKKLIEVHIIGKIDSYGSELVTLTKKLKLQKIIKFLNELHGRERNQKLFNFDLYVQCSYSEGASIALREAMFFSKSLIVSSSCNIDDIKDENFIIVTSTSPKSISNGIKKALLMNFDFIGKGYEAQLYALKQYNWRTISLSMNNQYRSILNR